MIKNIIFQLALFAFPWPIRRFLLTKFYGFDIAKSAKIGFSIICPVKLRMGEHSYIGNLTLVKGITSLDLGEYARLGSLNWVTGYPAREKKHFSHVTARAPLLQIGDHSAITSRHLIDCTDSVTIGCYSTFAGFRSQILTHSIDIYTSKQSCKPVSIGDYCFVGTNSVLLGGAVLPNKCVLAAKSLLAEAMDAEKALYGGCPARKIKSFEENVAYFNRATGFVN